MFFYRFFSILLHMRVYSSINLKSIGVQIIFCSIAFGILITPTVKRICFPVQRIFVVLLHLPRTVIIFAWFFGCEYFAEVFAEISGKTFFMIHAMVCQLQRKSLKRITFLGSNVIGFTHLVKHYISSPT